MMVVQLTKKNVLANSLAEKFSNIIKPPYANCEHLFYQYFIKGTYVCQQFIIIPLVLWKT
jgi:hypothetical protein